MIKPKFHIAVQCNGLIWYSSSYESNVTTVININMVEVNELSDGITIYQTLQTASDGITIYQTPEQCVKFNQSWQ